MRFSLGRCESLTLNLRNGSALFTSDILSVIKRNLMLEKSLYSQKTLFDQNDTFLIEIEMF